MLSTMVSSEVNSKLKNLQTANIMKVHGFRFSSPANLAQAQAFQVIADNYPVVNPMDRGELVVALSKNTADSYLAMIGIATGKQNEIEVEKVCPEWEHNNATVQGVKWISRIVEVPVELVLSIHSAAIVWCLACKSGNRMSAEHSENVFTFVMDNEFVNNGIVGGKL